MRTTVPIGLNDIPNQTVVYSHTDVDEYLIGRYPLGMNMPNTLFPRFIISSVREALADTPVVLIAGPRQAGKTTLVRQFISADRRYLTLDDELTRLAARRDPVGLIRSLDRAVIDEIQRAPELLLAIKKSVDEDRRAGRFLLTGSANLMTLPTVADSLAGRMETLRLLPLSQSEMRQSSTHWLEAVFDNRLPNILQPAVAGELIEIVLRGGYPEAVARATPRRRLAWAKHYIDALIQRDVRDIASIDKLDHLPRFLRALAQVAGQLCNYSQLGAQVGLDHKTASRYLTVFEQMFLLNRVEPWGSNRLSRLLKTPKVQFIDSGLLSALVELTPGSAEQNRVLFGKVLETFVYSEILKQATYSEADYRLFYYRDKDQYEVDVVIENTVGDVVGIEVKAAATLRESDLRGLKRLASVARDHFRQGVILYDGLESVPLGERLWAAPLATLWGE